MNSSLRKKDTQSKDTLIFNSRFTKIEFEENILGDNDEELGKL